jgi:pimeloyl-ACP methyl ester carboxylesterase
MMNRKIHIEELLIETGDKFPVRADLRSAAPGCELPVIIITHGFLGYKRWGFYPMLSERVAGAGFHVLTMSFSLNGVDEETGRITRPREFASNNISREIEDLESVCCHIRSGGLPYQVDKDKWGLIAHSRGAAVAILIAGKFPEIKSLVTWSTPSRLDRYTDRRKRLWKEEGALVFNDDRADGPLRLDYSYYEDIDRNRDGYDLPPATGALRIPHLMIHGERDAAVTVGEMMQLYPDGLPSNAHREIIPGCSHVFGASHPMQRSTKALERAVSLTEKWLDETLNKKALEESECSEKE